VIIPAFKHEESAKQEGLSETNLLLPPAPYETNDISKLDKILNRTTTTSNQNAEKEDKVTDTNTILSNQITPMSSDGARLLQMLTDRNAKITSNTTSVPEILSKKLDPIGDVSVEVFPVNNRKRPLESSLLLGELGSLDHHNNSLLNVSDLNNLHTQQIMSDKALIDLLKSYLQRNIITSAENTTFENRLVGEVQTDSSPLTHSVRGTEAEGTSKSTAQDLSSVDTSNPRVKNVSFKDSAIKISSGIEQNRLESDSKTVPYVPNIGKTTFAHVAVDAMQMSKTFEQTFSFGNSLKNPTLEQSGNLQPSVQEIPYGISSGILDSYVDSLDWMQKYEEVMKLTNWVDTLNAPLRYQEEDDIFGSKTVQYDSQIDLRQRVTGKISERL